MKKDRRPFWFGLGLGLFVFMTGAGLLAVDYQGRKLSFGDATPLVRVDRQPSRTQLTVKAFGQEKTWDVTRADQALEFLGEFFCLPPRREG